MKLLFFAVCGALLISGAAAITLEISGSCSGLGLSNLSIIGEMINGTVISGNNSTMWNITITGGL